MIVFLYAVQMMALPGTIVVFTLVLFLYSYLLYVNRHRCVPKNVPWVGVRMELLAKVRAHWRDWTQSKENIMTGYDQV